MRNMTERSRTQRGESACTCASLSHEASKSASRRAKHAGFLLTTAVAIAAAFLLVACGGGSAGPAGPAGASGMSTLVRITAEATGANCAAGGTRIDAGMDANANQALDAAEIGSTQYLCGGAAGTSGAAGLAGADSVSMLTLMADAGANCASGGKAVSVGLDANRNGVLDVPEMTSTGYVCNGASGTSTSGAAGLDSLLATVTETAGAHCSWGGMKTTSGLDSNGNLALDAGEVTSTTYVCNGAPSAELTWVDVTSTSVQAASNSGYLADNAGQVTITLPPAPAVGDIVKVTGVGAGGWKVAQNAGQRVYAGYANSNWSSRGPNGNWIAVATSADGMKLVATTDQLLYLSADGGATWTPGAVPAQDYDAVTSSSDGAHLMAQGGNQQLYISGDSGQTWAAAGVTPHGWVAIASSSDGSRLAAAEYGGVIYTSSDFGASWTPQLSQGGTWSGLTSSADGMTLIAVDANAGGLVYASHDAGLTWAVLPAPALDWGGVTVSADGTHITAIVRNGSGGIYTSNDSGLTWRQGTSVSGPWWGLAVSADGKVVAASIRAHNGMGPQTPGEVYLSTDSGATWVRRDPVGHFWSAVALTANGTDLIAVSNDGVVVTPQSTSRAGTIGAVYGAQFDTVDLQYVGNGLFSMIAHEGTPFAR